MPEKKFPMHGVVSSSILAAGFDNDKLRITFNNGRTYEYEGVPKSVYEGIFKADSPGLYVRKNIVKSGYNAKKL